ncbi:hypothetical protein [Streptomyces sp. CA-111067]|uniref:hypothetical protein n=1 Tax=Streptomyces sp. CA-111067 TaxID=3240046 RepID=UPI003D97F9B5
MILPFVHDGVTGTVTVAVERVNEPGVVGSPAESPGFPSCTAVVDHPARGYRAMFGWVQLVRSTDNSSDGTAFEMDPFRIFEDAPSPYCFYGVQPTLFDAPSRDERRPLAWLAHSFLAWTPLEPADRHVVPLTGFSWGFDIDGAGRITARPVGELAGGDWEAHRSRLGGWYPGWAFDRW